MHIHGGGQVTSGQSSQDGWKKTSKVCVLGIFFFFFFSFYQSVCFSVLMINSLISIYSAVQFSVGLDSLIFGSASLCSIIF
jgi:hypothetical protein